MQYFDERAYISAGALRPGENAYARNKFNQEASDKLPSNRDVPDTRSGRSGSCGFYKNMWLPWVKKNWGGGAKKLQKCSKIAKSKDR